MSSENLRFIDTHAYVFHRQLPFIESRRFTPASDTAYESFIDKLDSHAIDRAELSAVSIAASLLSSAFGPERLLWASDWPFIQHESTQHNSTQLAHLERWLPDVADRKKVLVDTPTELFEF
ncbi:amidohydrolase family protein [Pseudomonas sp. CDFA 553]|uniref:amidohydrolase family protein n=1 Tax=Pseudomonas quasicaspiana TaxID=2829821 RepID=UPI001E4394E2|nr:amidohydrolase family protein [Pseudomonas quasicaspiana]MCD5987217.1 amidohydrolase family protein [Pseudomonas quasicaspiana]